MDLQKKRDVSAKAIVDLCAKLNTACETYVETSTALGLETGAGHGPLQPLNRVRLLAEIQTALLILLPAAKLPGRGSKLTQAKFSRGASLAGIQLVERIPCP